MECLNCKNTNCLISKNATLPEIHELLEKKHKFRVLKGQDVIIEGAPVHGIYFVFKGKVKIFKTGLLGKEQINRFAQDGDIIGHRGFGAGQYHKIGAMAMENIVLCSFSSVELLKVLKTIPSLTFDFMSFYSEELNRSETKVRKFAQMTVREKVIDALLYINRKFGQTSGQLNFQLSRKQMADFTGTTDEQVTRVFSTLKKEKLILSNGKKIGINDIEVLKKEINEHNYFLDL
ncbi:MAG: Crp/Fnr family transcriptional regulator [Flavobacteriales bacterium]|nr:Crp/Fnr family transcriptional regulator [Flavobacteriales bacterium]